MHAGPMHACASTALQLSSNRVARVGPWRPRTLAALSLCGAGEGWLLLAFEGCPAGAMASAEGAVGPAVCPAA